MSAPNDSKKDAHADDKNFDPPPAKIMRKETAETFASDDTELSETDNNSQEKATKPVEAMTTESAQEQITVNQCGDEDDESSESVERDVTVEDEDEESSKNTITELDTMNNSDNTFDPISSDESAGNNEKDDLPKIGCTDEHITSKAKSDEGFVTPILPKCRMQYMRRTMATTSPTDFVFSPCTQKLNPPMSFFRSHQRSRLLTMSYGSANAPSGVAGNATVGDVNEDADADDSASEDGDESIGEDRDESIGENADESIGEDADESIGEDADESIGEDGDESTGENGDESTGEDGDESNGEDGDETNGEDEGGISDDDADENVEGSEGDSDGDIENEAGPSGGL